MATRNAAKLKAQPIGEFTAHQSVPVSPNLLPPWKPGQSGNPTGRPRGARSKLSEKVIQALLDNFERNGATTIEEVRIKQPAAYLAACVSLLPKQQEKLDSPFSDLTEDELNLLEHFLKSTRARTVTTIDADATETTAPLPSATSDSPESSCNTEESQPHDQS